MTSNFSEQLTVNFHLLLLAAVVEGTQTVKLCSQKNLPVLTQVDLLKMTVIRGAEVTLSKMMTTMFYCAIWSYDHKTE